MLAQSSTRHASSVHLLPVTAAGQVCNMRTQNNLTLLSEMRSSPNNSVVTRVRLHPTSLQSQGCCTTSAAPTPTLPSTPFGDTRLLTRPNLQHHGFTGAHLFAHPTPKPHPKPHQDRTAQPRTLILFIQSAAHREASPPLLPSCRTSYTGPCLAPSRCQPTCPSPCSQQQLPSPRAAKAACFLVQ